jgi:hypothetical protein
MFHDKQGMRAFSISGRKDYFCSDWTVFEYDKAKTEKVKRNKKGEDYYFEDIELAKILGEKARLRLIKRIISRFAIKNYD